MILALVLAAAPMAPVELHALSAGLLAPTTKNPVGALRDVPFTAVRWLSPTLVRVRHDSATVELEALIDLSRDGTYVELETKRSLALSGSPWTLVLREGARVPLLGRVGDGLRLGFLPTDFPVVTSATLPDVERPVPPATAPVEKCVVHAIYAKADKAAPRWEIGSKIPYAHRGASKDGWAPAWVDSGTLIVHGFVHDRDVNCREEEFIGELGLTGVSTGMGDGQVEAQAAVLPAGTKLFATTKEVEPFATLKLPARGLLLKDGTWRIADVKSGAGEVRFTNVFVGRDTPLALEKLATHGVGSSIDSRPTWPRFKR